MDKAIEIKRRAQRFIQTGDLDGALGEYNKLVATEDSDPYNYVLLADLLFKKGDAAGASERYLHAIAAYEKAGLYKNAIAVCKKMMRLSLSSPHVLQRLAHLHALDGLGTEAALYFQQYAEHQIREGRYAEAAVSLRKAFDACSDSLKVLEKLADAYELAGDTAKAARAWAEAAHHHRERGHEGDASRCASRAEALEPGALERFETDGSDAAAVEESATAFAETADRFDDGADLIERNGAHLGEIGDPGTVVSDETGVGMEIERTEIAPLPSGLRFETEPTAPPVPAAPAAPAVPEVDVEGLLRRAETEFRAGNREAAAATLIQAADGYERIGKPESAAVIYRSLSKSPVVPEEVFTRWLANAEGRGEAREAAEVSCQLGERAVVAGDHEAARTWFERAKRHDPENELAQRRLQRLGDEPAPAAPVADPGKVSLATRRADAMPPELDGLLAEFRRAVESQIAGDTQSQYDLGVTYREMGFAEQAIESFRAAGTDRAFAQRCAEMIGRCLLDLGKFDDAIREFEAALELPTLTPETGASLRFELGLAHEAAGRPAQALQQFEQAYRAQPNLSDVGQKIRELKRTLGQG